MKKYNIYSKRPSEIFIGLIGPVGVDKNFIYNILKDNLAKYNYTTEHIKISRLIKGVYKKKAKWTNEYMRLNKLMDLGNEIRNKTNNNSILSMYSIAEIGQIRKTKYKDKICKVAYIIDSLKHPDEVKELRKIYGQGFYLIAIHIEKEKRISYLIERKNIKYKKKAEELIQRDEHEDLRYGQQTRNAFQSADFFIHYDGNEDKTSNSIARTTRIIFGDPFTTPTFNEYSMFMAYASSIRSGDLSRQVGAVISIDNDIISTGANDCPKFGGGLYWPIYDPKKYDIKDILGGRDYTNEYDPNVKEKDEIINRIVKDVKYSEIEKVKLNIENSGLSEITEYGRVVHAEMEALLSCARRNISCRGATLYCTTFPCHICAKHIVAAGIKQVLYIEPYPKSKSFELFKDSISDNKNDENKKLIFQPFVGVGPRLFINLFSLHLSNGRMIRRKDDKGKKAGWSPSRAYPRLPLFPVSYRDLEKISAQTSIELFKHYKIGGL